MLLLICGGGVAAVIGLVSSMSGALNERAHKAVTEYLDAVDSKQYVKAYGLLCRQARDDETPSEYTERISQNQPIQRYQLGDLDLVNLSVPVDATYRRTATPPSSRPIWGRTRTRARSRCATSGSNLAVCPDHPL